LTNTAISSVRRYWENTDRLLSAVNVSIVAAVTVFPEEIYQAPRSWTERAYHKLICFDEVDEGGHFRRGSSLNCSALNSATDSGPSTSQSSSQSYCVAVAPIRSGGLMNPGQIANCRAVDTQRRIFRQGADLLESAGTAVLSDHAYRAAKQKRNGAPDTIRTCDLCLRRATLYPAELRVQRGLI
jgi:hypothetical protein